MNGHRTVEEELRDEGEGMLVGGLGRVEVLQRTVEYYCGDRYGICAG